MWQSSWQSDQAGRCRQLYIDPKMTRMKRKVIWVVKKKVEQSGHGLSMSQVAKKRFQLQLEMFLASQPPKLTKSWIQTVISIGTVPLRKVGA